MAMKIRTFPELDVWKLGKAIVLDVYRFTKGFPREEMYGLVSQMRRAVVSTPSNAAEGLNRRHNPEYRQLLYVALESCAETHIEVAHDLGFLSGGGHDKVLEKLDHESRLLENLIKRL